VLCKSVRFAMPFDQLVFSADTAALPMTRKNTDIHAAAAEIATDLLAE
jgi:glutamate racemase